MAKTNYSLLTLTPTDDEEKKLFWKFRVDSMQSQFQIYTAVVTISFLQSLANAVYQQDSYHTFDTVYIGSVLSCQVIIIIVGKRCTQRFVTYLYPLMFGLTFGPLLVKWWYFRKGHEFTFETHFEIMGETSAILIGFLCYSTIFCPSLFFMLFVYSPIYLLIHVTYMYLQYDMSDDAVYFFNLRILIVFVLQGVLFFVLVQ